MKDVMEVQHMKVMAVGATEAEPLERVSLYLSDYDFCQPQYTISTKLALIHRMQQKLADLAIAIKQGNHHA